MTPWKHARNGQNQAQVMNTWAIKLCETLPALVELTSVG